MENEQNIIVIRDEDTLSIVGVYDIKNMDGDVKDYYDNEFESMDEYEKDMIDRGATSLSYTGYLI